MATHDYVIDNSTGANVRADINNVLQAILTNNSSSSAPSTTAAYMFWADTTSGTLKIRNSSDNAWVELLQLDGTLTLEDGSVSAPGLAFRDDLDTGIFSSASNTFNITTGGVERLELSGTATVFNESGADVNFRIEGDTQQHLFFVDAGNNLIGIGTSSPSNAHAGADDLVIGDYSASGAGISINTTTSGSGNIYFGDASGTNRRGRIEYDHANDAFRIYTGDSERLRVDSSGRLLIGTTSSRTIQGASKLQIEDDTTSLLSIVRTSNNNGAAFITIGKTRNGSILQNGDVIGVLNFHGDDGSDLVTPAAQIRAAVDGTPGSNDMPGRLEFLTTLDGNSASSERMRITNAGNVGINDTEPDAKLSVFMSAINIGYGASGNSSGTFKLIQGYGYRIGTNLYGNVGIYTTYDSGTNQGSLDFYTGTGGTGTAERMRIAASGNVGIGTTTIDQKLTIGDGDLKFFNSDAGNNHRTTFIEFQNSSNRITSESNFGSDGSSAYAAGYKFGTKNFTGSAFESLTPFVIQANGNVGIGTTSPDRRLDCIKGGTKISRFQQTTNNQGEDHTCITLRHAAAISGQNGVGMIFQNSGGSVVGKIDFGQSTTQYRTSSDYRLKENAVSISDGITRLKTLKPYRFNFIAEPDKTVDGFFAHEVTAVPEAISGTKDEVDANNNPVYQGIDQSKLVPLLVAAVQELITKVETLEAA